MFSGAIIGGLIGALLNAATYGVVVSAIADFVTELIAQNNDFTVSLFDNGAVTSFIGLISLVGSILFLFGVVFAFAEWGIDVNEHGGPNVLATFKNCFIGLAAVSGFATLPILLLKYINELSYMICSTLSGTALENATRNLFSNLEDSNFFSGWGSPIFSIIILICVVKVFFANIKRGGIMVTLITVGSLHMFSIPRGYTDAFWSWCKQVIGLCVTSFLQNVLLVLGMMTYVNSDIDVFDLVLGAGVMLSASEVPRILQQFGLDTSMKANVNQAIFGISGVMNIASAFMK